MGSKGRKLTASKTVSSLLNFFAGWLVNPVKVKDDERVPNLLNSMLQNCVWS
jgi:hypothetical protein